MLSQLYCKVKKFAKKMLFLQIKESGKEKKLKYKKNSL